MNIVIGKADGKNVHLDVDKLLSSRLLVQANSGKGKSHLLRRIAEQLFSKVQVIILDPEGEFATLREKYGYVLVGKGGETPADPRSAALVAHKLLELKASAVVDLYEMKPAARHEYVRAFLDALIDAPKQFWHPLVVIVDEAHIFCPEKGAGESVASEAMIGLATRGRKRGFACIFATQRLGKLRKDAAAELLNLMIGGTFIDIDRKRAADALGFYGAEKHEFFDKIKVMERGNFYTLGPAISLDRILVHVGEVETSHPEAGSAKHGAEPPPAPEAIAKLLPKLSDLPKAAEEKAKTEADLRAEVRSLKAQLRQAPQETKGKQVTVVDEKAIARAVANTEKTFQKSLAQSAGLVAKLQKFLVQFSQEAAKLAGVKLAEIPAATPNLVRQPSLAAPKLKEPKDWPRPKPEAQPTNGDLTSSQAAILRALMNLEVFENTTPSREQLAFWSCVPPTSGGYKNNLGALRTMGAITYPTPRTVSITDHGREQIGNVDAVDLEEVIERGKRILTDSQNAILDVLVGSGELVSREDLAAAVDVPVTSGGFKNNLGAMRTAGLIDYPAAGMVKAADWLLH
jgi:uncharacterized protein DUF87